MNINEVYPGIVLLATLCVQVLPPEHLYTEKNQDSTEVNAAFEHFTEGAKFQPGVKQVSWRRFERSGASAEWHVSENTYATRLRVVEVASREGGRITYVAGIDNTGNSVIERWTFPAKPGRWSHAYSGVANPIGTPTPPYTGTTSIISPPFRALPAVWYAPNIDVLLDTSVHGYIDSMQVDPEGRFLLFGTYADRRVYQLDLFAPGMPVSLLFSPSSIPELASLPALSIANHDILGRVCVALPAQALAATADPSVPAPDVVYMVDSNNDGVFETQQVVPFATHTNSLLLGTLSQGGNPIPSPAGSPWSTPWASGF